MASCRGLELGLQSQKDLAGLLAPPHPSCAAPSKSLYELEAGQGVVQREG